MKIKTRNIMNSKFRNISKKNMNPNMKIKSNMKMKSNMKNKTKKNTKGGDSKYKRNIITPENRNEVLNSDDKRRQNSTNNTNISALDNKFNEKVFHIESHNCYSYFLDLKSKEAIELCKKDLVVFLTKREHLEKIESLFRISSLI